MARMFTLFSILFLLFATNNNFVLAEDSENIPSVGIEVDHVSRGFEKINEKVTLFFKFSKTNKLNYKKYLVTKRLAELKYAVDSNQIDLIEPTASRYSTYIGKLSEYIVDKNLTDKKGELLKTYEDHAKIIKHLQKNYEYDSGWWLAIQHDLSVITIFTEQLQNL